MAAEDLYKVLGVSPTVDAAALKSAYRGLARQLHPDHNNNDPTCAAAMKRVNAAYEVLSDPKRRARYDLIASSPFRAAEAPRTVQGEGFRVTLGETRVILERFGNDLLDVAARQGREKLETVVSKVIPMGERGKKILDEVAALGKETGSRKLAEFLKKYS